MEILSIPIVAPAGTNVVVGQAHFIKTVEDLAEIVVTTVPSAKYGLAFNESSGPCLVRCEANDPELRQSASQNAEAIGAGHAFVLLLRECYPLNVLGRIKDCPEVCSVFCATANPVEVVVAESAQGRGILGVIDGNKPKGVESAADVADRKGFLRGIGYKF
ncbi:MAG TPA: adenosine-specific kinase [Candidatus Binatia bacterium]|nr:adenosine-specific kinase [Candidatus Binatia bacterium]